MSMSSDTAQRIFQATETILEDLNTVERLTLKDVSNRIAAQTGLGAATISPVVQMYVKGRHDLVLRKGRNGGIRRAVAEMAKQQAVETGRAIEIVAPIVETVEDIDGVSDEG